MTASFGTPTETAGSHGRSTARCVVLHPRLSGTAESPREPQASLDEAVGLAQAIDLDVVLAEVVPLPRPRPGTLLGTGAIERLAAVISGNDGDAPPDTDGEDTDPESRPARRPRRGRKPDRAVDVVVVNNALTPVQQRNLERAWKCKVIDRTGLILEIFGARARTREGSLQVELAALTYARSRLVRSWTHLERQRGGLGFVGGPGETQIETDRRLIGERIGRIKRQLADVRRTRGLHREARRRVPYPVVALVGYTNAGKSTLFNALTRAGTIARDQLFATLDPAMRGLDLPSGQTVILSDTVGFISDLPHELVAAFHATLEEVREADAIVHVRDASHPDTEAQRADVLGVLGELGLEGRVEDQTIEVLNKADLLDAERRAGITARLAQTNAPGVLVSALTGEGCDRLCQVVDEWLTRDWCLVDVSLAPEDGRTLAWLYRHGHVVSRQDGEDAIRMSVRLNASDAARFAGRGDNSAGSS